MSYLQQIDNKDFVKELVRRHNKGTINLNLIGCCQILYLVFFVRENLQKDKDLPHGDCCFTMNSVFITSLLTCLKKENKLCPNCLEWLGKIEQEKTKKEPNQVEENKL